MPPPPEIYLDIETTWEGEPTVIGFRSRETGLVQLVGSEIALRRLLTALPRAGRLFTFNGHSFDLPRIRSALGVDLRERFDSIDLMHVGRRYGLRGGQKAIEQAIGFRRHCEGLDGRDAIRLWKRYCRGDDAALETLLRYNAEDIEGMVVIKRYLWRMGWRA